MLVGSFLSGLVPMALKLSDNKSRLLALLGSGILVGTALAIIIPEGIDSLYGQYQPIPIKNLNTKLTKAPSIDNSEQINLQQLTNRPDPNKTWTVGMSLIVGFILMLLIDQFSIFQGINESHHSTEQQIHSQHNYTLASQDDDVDIGYEEESNKISEDLEETTSETKPIKDARVVIRATDSTNSSHHTGVQIHSSPNRYYDHSRHIINNRTKNTKVTPTLGLVIHAAADGIALGAAATTSHREIEMIIFLAIMLHKAPAAFSLVVLLLHRGLKHSTIRRHLLAFSLSAPIAAMVTYFGLSQSGKEALRRNNATGIAMLFSAGTFLFVATVHVLPELVHNKLLSLKELVFLVGGAFLPLLLAQTV